MKYGQHFIVNPNLEKVINGLGHSSDDDMHLTCLSTSREINQWQTRSKIISIWFLEIETHHITAAVASLKST
jgi:hypothetical protein